MDNILRSIGEKLIEKKSEIAKEYARHRTAEKPNGIPTTGYEEIERLAELLGQTLIDSEDQTAHLSREWGKDLGKLAIKEGVSLDHALHGLNSFHTVIWGILEKEVESVDIPVKTVFSITRKIDRMLDEVVYHFSQIFAENYKQSLESAKQSMNQLSVPVVPIYDEVAVLPIVGEVDTERAKYIMEKALSTSTELQLSHLIIDLSGVLVIDTMVAHNLFQVVDSLELIGVKTVLTGIRPEIAQTVTSLGIDFGHVSTCATMKQALVMLGFVRENT